MQEPLNFSSSSTYPQSQEVVACLLNCLQPKTDALTNSNPFPDFDCRASPRAIPTSGVDHLLSPPPNPLSTFQSSALLAAAAATMATSNASTCPREVQFEELLMKASIRTGSHPIGVGENLISNQFLNSIPAYLHNSSSPQPLDFRQSIAPSEMCAIGDLHARAPSHSSKKNSKPRDRSRRARVVIHQFGDAEDHFSKALRNLHVKSRAEDEVTLRSSAPQNRMWRVTDSLDGLDGICEDGNGSCWNGVSSLNEAQNIADLAVEKHFEKSLATFHAKQAAAEAMTSPGRGSYLNKTPLDLSLTRTQQPSYPPSPSVTSSSDGSTSPRAESGGLSFNPKKKWLAQYGDDEGAKMQTDGAGESWSAQWEAGKLAEISPTKKMRSMSCPLLFNTCKSIDGSTLSHSERCPTLEKTLDLFKFSRVNSQSPSSSSLKSAKRASPGLSRTVSLIEQPTESNPTFYEGNQLECASKSISPNETPALSPVAASSGFFTGSNYSLNSSILAVISEAAGFSSAVSGSSSFKERPVAVLKDSNIIKPFKSGYSFSYEPEEALTSVIESNGQFCAIRKRTAFDSSNISSLKRSRSVIASTIGGCER